MTKPYKYDQKQAVRSKFLECKDLMNLWEHAHDAQDPEAMREALRLLRLKWAEAEAKAETRTCWAEKGVKVEGYAS